jgi:L-asparaginase/Glu-tRNA(Gln) amidotransferase subunit D
MLTLAGFRRQLTGQLIDPGFQGAVGVGDLPGHLVKQIQRCVHCGIIILCRKQCGYLVVGFGRGVGGVRAGLPGTGGRYCRLELSHASP